MTKTVSKNINTLFQKRMKCTGIGILELRAPSVAMKSSVSRLGRVQNKVERVFSQAERDVSQEVQV